MGPWTEVTDVIDKGRKPNTQPSSRTVALTPCFHGARVVDSSLFSTRGCGPIAERCGEALPRACLSTWGSEEIVHRTFEDGPGAVSTALSARWQIRASWNLGQWGTTSLRQGSPDVLRPFQTMTLQLSCGCSHLPSPVPAGPSWPEPSHVSKWGFLLHSPLPQKVITTAFKGSHIFCLLNTECSGLVSLKKGLVVNHCDSISSWESRFFLSTQWRTPNAGGPESMASLSFPQGHTECVRCWQHRPWRLLRPTQSETPTPCSSVGLLTDVKAPRFVLCLTHRFRRTADNKITWECPLYSKSGAEFRRKLCKKELPTISCVWKSTHVCAFRRSKVKKCYIKHLPDSAVSYFNCVCICIKSMHHTKL